MQIRLYISEEQQLLREAYRAFFSKRGSGSEPADVQEMFVPRAEGTAIGGIQLVGCSADTSVEHVEGAVEAFEANVLLLGVANLQPSVVEGLERIREHHPDLAIVLLCSYYNVETLKAVRQFCMKAPSGCACLLRHTIDSADQLANVIYSVFQRRVMFDPTVMEGLMVATEPWVAFLKSLSQDEIHVLSWMAKGYSDKTIGDILSLDPAAIERNKRSIYAKLGTSESRHARVHAVIAYLSATGQLQSNQGLEPGLSTSLAVEPTTKTSTSLAPIRQQPIPSLQAPEQEPEVYDVLAELADS